MNRTVDFDAFRAEQAGEPLVLRLGGREWHLPAALPAALALDIARLQATRGPDGVFSETDVERLGAGLFGGVEHFHEILREGGVTIDEMPELISRVLAAYGASGDAPPNRAARRARAGKHSTS